MSTDGKREVTSSTQQQQRPKTNAPAQREEASVSRAVTETIRDAVFERRPYLKYAFANPYNITLLAGGLAASVLTLNPFLAVATLGLEGLWLLHGPESKLLRRLLWDPRFEKVRLALEQQARADRLVNLGEWERARVENLVAREAEIKRLAAQNPSFTGELLRTELAKTTRLVDAYIDMAVTCARYEEYLGSIDRTEIERERRRWETAVKSGGEGEIETEIARKNLAIINKRFDRMSEITRYLKIARGQLDLIENSFQLIADQIVTMQSPQGLSGQLDELLDGVEAIKETTAETEKLFKNL